MSMNIQKIDKLNAYFTKVLMYLSIFFSGIGLIKYSLFEKHNDDFIIFTSSYKFDTATFINQFMHYEGYAFMMAGVIILMMLPIIRVIFALLGFIYNKNVLYIVISVSIMLIIGISFYLGIQY
jgi:uncharacterized membrane protein